MYSRTKLMPVYTVHAPSAPASRDDTDRFVFLRDGFHFWAMVFGPLWLLWHRLWLALLGYLVVGTALAVAMALLGAPSDARGAVVLLLALLMGLEAASLRRWAYSRGKWQLVDFIVADDKESAERSFFHRWTESAGPPVPPTYNAPMTSYPARTPGGGSQGIIGLFPEPGGSR
jgi:hypothetical protein